MRWGRFCGSRPSCAIADVLFRFSSSFSYNCFMYLWRLSSEAAGAAAAVKLFLEDEGEGRSEDEARLPFNWETALMPRDGRRWVEEVSASGGEDGCCCCCWSWRRRNSTREACLEERCLCLSMSSRASSSQFVSSDTLTGILCLQESRMEKHIVERGRERAGCTF